MDETPYLEEFSKSTLDSIIDFMNRKTIFVSAFISFMIVKQHLTHVYHVILKGSLKTI